MDAELDRFRQEVARLQTGKVHSSVRFPDALRVMAALSARSRVAFLVSIRPISQHPWA